MRLSVNCAGGLRAWLVLVVGLAVGLGAARAEGTRTFSDQPEALNTAAKLPAITIEGNHFVNDAGETVVFRGLAFSDPVALVRRGQWSRRYFEEAKAWHANIVRVPVHPVLWRQLGEAEYLKLLDQAVQWSGELGLYVIIDWHTIGNLMTGVFHVGDYQTSKDETFRFWHTIAQRYRGNPTVAMYELYNEPTSFNGTLGRLDWREYKAFIEDLIYMLRHIDEHAIPLVAGFNWGYDLTHVRDEPIGYPGVAYVTHPYPQKRRDHWVENWQNDWGFVAEKYPVVATEFGFMREGERGSHNPVIGDTVYGEAIIKFFEERGISWTPWVFDVEWTPNLISDWDFTPTTQGAFFRQKMIELNR